MFIQITNSHIFSVDSAFSAVNLKCDKVKINIYGRNTHDFTTPHHNLVKTGFAFLFAFALLIELKRYLKREAYKNIREF